MNESKVRNLNDFQSNLENAIYILRLKVRLDTAENWKLKLKTEKYCSKITFKYMNSTVRSIFNEKIDKKWYLWVHKQCTNVLFTVEKVSLYGWKQKKKKKKKEAETRFAPRRGCKTRKPNQT